VSQPTPPNPPELPAGDERLTTVQAFSRFVGRVTPYAGRWLARWRVPEEDRDDVLQETLLRTYQHRESYDPALGRHVDWAYGFLGQVVRNHRKTRARRIKRVSVATVDLPEVAVDGLTPEEEADRTMRARLFDTCLATLDDDLAAILLARDVDEIAMKDIAVAHGVSLRTAYAYYQEARERLQEALEREQGRKRALGVGVLPITPDQLLVSGREGSDVSETAMRRVWKALDRAMAADRAAGKLGDDGRASAPNPA
jgi:RNA polymerase sigma factor (sigma-70 family)